MVRGRESKGDEEGFFHLGNKRVVNWDIVLEEVNSFGYHSAH